MNAGGLYKAEPVIVKSAVGWLLLQAGLLVVDHWHLLSDTAWSSLAQALAPVVTAVAMGLLAWAIRRVVTPAWKWLDVHAPTVAGAAEDAGLALLDEAMAQAQATHPIAEPETVSP